MLKSSLCDYSDVYAFFKESIPIAGAGANDDKHTETINK